MEAQIELRRLRLRPGGSDQALKAQIELHTAPQGSPELIRPPQFDSNHFILLLSSVDSLVFLKEVAFGHFFFNRMCVCVALCSRWGLLLSFYSTLVMC